MGAPTDIPYNPNVPEKPADSLAEGQPELLNNFLQLYNAFLVNHIPLDSASGAGNHTIVQLLEQENSQQTGVNEISVYVKDAPGSTDQIFLKYQGNPGQEFQYTCYQTYGLTQTVDFQPFFTFLPGRILVYSGFIGGGLTQTKTINLYPPIATNIISVIFCPSGTNGNVPISSVKPYFTVEKDEKGFFSIINLASIVGGLKLPVNECYYLIMVNI